MLNKLENLFASFWIWQVLGWISYWLMISLAVTTIRPNTRGFFNLAGFFLVRIFFGFFLSSLMRFIYRSKITFSSLSKSLFLALCCSFLFGSIWAYLMVLYKGFINAQISYGGLTKRLPGDLFELSLTLLGWSSLYIGIKYWRALQTEREQTLQAKALAQEAELKMLRYQLNPHFLFNSLNSASALIAENPSKAEKMIGELSEFLRYSLITTKEELIDLKGEIQAIKNYLNIEQIRFEEKLKVSFNITPEVENTKIPNFLLHPLVENAIKYGMQTSQLPLKIEIKAAKENNSVVIEIINTGKWFENQKPKENETRVGIENVKKRLEQFFPKQHLFKSSEENGHVRILIKINSA